MNHYDLTILGSGPAGKRAAVQAAKLGKSVLLVDDRDRVGGVSVHTGTIPSKTLRETALNLSGWRERGFYGQSYRVKKEIRGSDLNLRLNQTLGLEIDALEHQLARNGVRIARGHGRFLDAHRLIITSRVGDQVVEQLVTTQRTLIAVGTRPFHPDNVPFDGETILDSDTIVGLERLPRSLTVVGAGVIGLEYATIFNTLDVPVTLIEPRATILDFMDREVVDNLICQLRDRAMILRFGCEVDRVEHDASGAVRTYLSDGRVVRSDMLLYTAGRMGATAKLGLELCGIDVDHRGRITVNPLTFQTDHPDIYAAGDVIGFPSLASTSMEQGRIAACHAFGVALPAKPAHFPFGIYAVPEISSVGLTEEQACVQGIQYECGIARLRETSRGHIMGLANGFMKLIFALDDGRLLGVHIIGEGATELIHIGQAVLNLGGTLDYFIENSFNYPTLAEAYKVAALDAWNRMAVQAQPVSVAPATIKPAAKVRKAA